MKEFLAKGKRGLIYRSTWKGKEVIIKEKNPCSEAKGNLENEYNFLKLLNKHGIGPNVNSFQYGQIIMEYISGELIIDYIRRSNKNDVLSIIKKIFKQLRTMDKLQVNKGEMTNPYKHIIVRNKEPIMIDFERCRKTEKPQNVTQFSQFLIRAKIKIILEEKDIKINKEKLMKLAKKYKESYLEKDYQNLIKEVK